MSNIEALLLVYVLINCPIAVWHLVIVIQREEKQMYMDHLRESIKNRDATITRQEQQLARNEKLVFSLEERLKDDDEKS